MRQALIELAIAICFVIVMFTSGLLLGNKPDTLIYGVFLIAASTGVVLIWREEIGARLRTRRAGKI